jgi:hypothetical protein
MDGVQMIVLVVVGITAVVFFVCWILFTANRQGVDAIHNYDPGQNMALTSLTLN